MVKAVRDLGLPIGKVVFNGESISVELAVDNGDKPVNDNGHEAPVVPRFGKPKL
jgi:hypothetical protein